MAASGRCDPQSCLAEKSPIPDVTAYSGVGPFMVQAAKIANDLVAGQIASAATATKCSNSLVMRWSGGAARAASIAALFRRAVVRGIVFPSPSAAGGAGAGPVAIVAGSPSASAAWINLRLLWATAGSTRIAGIAGAGILVRTASFFSA